MASGIKWEKKMKFKKSLTISYFILSVCIVVVTYASLNLIMKNSFKDYVINKQLSQNNQILEKIEESYKNNNLISKEEIEHIGMSALDSGIILKVEDNDTLIWSAIDHNNGLCKEMLELRATEMEKYHRKEKSTYEEQTYQIEINGDKLIDITMGYYGPYYYTSEDIKFLNNINMITAIVSVIAFILSVIIGSIFSKKISLSLQKITNAAKDLFNNNYEKKIFDNTQIVEFRELIEQFNKLSEKLSDEKQLRDRLSNDIAHELRTPLAIIQGYIEALIDGVYKVDEKTLNNLNNEIKRFSHLIEKLEREDKYDNLELESVDLKSLIQKHIDNSIKTLADKKITVKFESKTVKAVVDAEKIDSLVLNLLSNAIKYSDLKKEVIIKLSSQKNFINISFSNYGMPIPESEKEKIFERFYRIDNSRTRQTGGHGIGLSIVKSVVIAHGGTIDLELDGNKTTFSVKLPKTQ